MDAVTSCLNILRRTPPCDTEQNLAGLTSLLTKEYQVEELLQRVDAPLKVATDPEADERPYIICDHNRDGDSYRSPWSNAYYPQLSNTATSSGGFKPNYQLRQLEIQANEVFQIYQELYYGKEDDVVSSVYLWETAGDGPGASNTSSVSQSNASPYGNGFAAIFLIRKVLKNSSSPLMKDGYWNSIHVVDVEPISPSLNCTYNLTTTILISINDHDESQSSSENGDNDSMSDGTTISGSLTRQAEKTCAVDKDGNKHLENIGRMIEEMEHFLRFNMDSLYIQKTNEILNNVRPGRPTTGIGEPKSISGVPSGEVATHTSLLNQAVLAQASKNEE